MEIDKILQKLEIPKEGIFYKCPYCDYKNADKKAILKHIKSKHPEEIKKEADKMNKAKKQQKRRPQQKKRTQQPKETIDYKDYLYLFAHKKRCLIILEDGTTIEGLVKAKDRYTIMVLDSNYTPKGWDKPAERLLLHKGHIVNVIPIDEDNKE